MIESFDDKGARLMSLQTPTQILAQRPTLATLPDCTRVLESKPKMETLHAFSIPLGQSLDHPEGVNPSYPLIDDAVVRRESGFVQYGLLAALGIVMLVVGVTAMLAVNPHQGQQLRAIRSLLSPQETALLSLESPAGKLLAASPDGSQSRTLQAGAGVMVNHGRQDPLQPLVKMAKPTAAEEIARQDPLTGVSFVGLLEGPATGRSAGKRDIAMIEVIDAASQETRTLVKPVGELFYSNGSSIQIKKANQGLLEVVVDGEVRHLPLTLGQAGLGKKDKLDGASTEAIDKLAE